MLRSMSSCIYNLYVTAEQGHSCKIGNACFTGTLKKINPNLFRKVNF